MNKIDGRSSREKLEAGLPQRHAGRRRKNCSEGFSSVNTGHWMRQVMGIDVEIGETTESAGTKKQTIFDTLG